MDSEIASGEMQRLKITLHFRKLQGETGWALSE
jgi:hypothetical protein